LITHSAGCLKHYINFSFCTFLLFSTQDSRTGGQYAVTERARRVLRPGRPHNKQIDEK